MNKNVDVRKIVITGIELVGMVGVAKILRYITPPYQGPFGTAACYVAGVLLTAATADIFEKQILKYEAVLENISRGDKVVVF